MEGRELPAGWSQAEIGDLCELQNGRAFKSSDWKEVGVPIVRIQNLNKANASFNYYQGPVDERNRLKGGELLFAWSGTPGTSFGAHVWNGGEAVLNQHIFRVDFDESLIDKRFFRFAINQKLNELIDNAHGGVGLRHVTKGKFEKTEVAVPPFNEQRRIAAKLNTTLAAVEACRQRLDGVAAILKRFRQAVLAAATSGELTREWREENSIDREWEDQALGDLLSDIRYGTAQKCTYDICGKPVLRIPNILDGAISHKDLKYAEFDQQEVSRLSIRAGDLLVIRSNGSLDLVGRTALAIEADEGCLFAGYLIRLRPIKDVVSPGFLLWFFLSPVTRRRIELAARSTSGVNNINSKFLSGLQLRLPSLEEQQEIYRRVQDLFSLADQLEAKLTAARKVVDRLTPALLAKAFRGELVPQNPNDEPASVLLERIRAARQAEAAAGKPSRRGRRKAAAHPEQAPPPAAPAPPDLLAQLLQECGALTERALLAASELDPAGFRAQLALEQGLGVIRETAQDGQVLLEAAIP
jgi:type I restriction enzyme S subunit